MIIFDQVELHILSGGVALSSAAFGEFALAFNKRASMVRNLVVLGSIIDSVITLWRVTPINTINFWSGNGISGGKG